MSSSITRLNKTSEIVHNEIIWKLTDEVCRCIDKHKSNTFK